MLLEGFDRKFGRMKAAAARGKTAGFSPASAASSPFTSPH
jgi:hypothetical protein